MTSPVKVLEAKDICRNHFTRGDKHCFIGWLRNWFGFDSVEYRKALKIARQITGHCSLIAWNDHWWRPEAEIASAINKVTAKLGHTEGNPEA